jgi:cell division protein FtsB
MTKLWNSMNFVQILIAILILLIVQLQYRLWLGDGGRREVWVYQERLGELEKDAKAKKERNDALYADVLDLNQDKTGHADALEERARYDLGMIRKDETFFQIIE